MPLTNISTQFGKGGHGLTDGTLAGAIKELQGLTVTVVAGAAAGTAMAVPALRKEDTLCAALCTVDAGGAASNDVANMTIQSTSATGTVTISGNPVEGETVTINGAVFTFRAVPTSVTDVKITAGNVTAMAAALAAAVNGYDTRLLPNGAGYKSAVLKATSAAGVVTINALVDGVAGNSIALAKAATNVSVSGATLTGGTATGGVKSTSNLAGKSVTLFWYNKQ
jgi:hypothetical protein